jgi:hypothetical protein
MLVPNWQVTLTCQLECKLSIGKSLSFLDNLWTHRWWPVFVESIEWWLPWSIYWGYFKWQSDLKNLCEKKNMFEKFNDGFHNSRKWNHSAMRGFCSRSWLAVRSVTDKHTVLLGQQFHDLEWIGDMHKDLNSLNDLEDVRCFISDENNVEVFEQPVDSAKIHSFNRDS